MEGQGVDITTTSLGELSDSIGNVLDFGFGVGKIIVIGSLSIVGLILLSILVKLLVLIILDIASLTSAAA